MITLCDMNTNKQQIVKVELLEIIKKYLKVISEIAEKIKWL